MKNYSKEVQEIHRAFHTAGDELIIRAKEILKDKSRRDVLKAKRLNELGFTYAKQSDIKEDLSKLSEGEIGIIEAEKLHYYQIRYPNNKYITLEQVKTICEKYNLLFADICRYKGFVPDKNLDEIELFKVEPVDIGTETASCEAPPYEPKYLRYTLDGGAKFLDYKRRQVPASYYTTAISVKSGLKICAPEIDIETKPFFTEINGEWYDLPKLEPIKMFDTLDVGAKPDRFLVIPDPVVLQPVQYGFLIITAWGDEASDENVVNPKNN
jgi:hypothetical protein